MPKFIMLHRNTPKSYPIYLNIDQIVKVYPDKDFTTVVSTSTLTDVKESIDEVMRLIYNQTGD